MGTTSVVFAYVGPDMLLPVASGVAGAVGALLMFGRTALRFLRQACRRILRRAEP